MKLTKQQLKQIIKEELESVLEGQSNDMTQFGLRGPGDWGTHSSQPEEVFGATAGASQDPTTDLASELERELVPLRSQGADREEMSAYLSELQIDLGGVTPEDAVDWWLGRNQS